MTLLLDPAPAQAAPAAGGPQREKLLSPVEAAGLRFKNRIIHAPTTLNMSDPSGHVTRKLVAAYETLARGGYSATIVGATCVRRDGLINERMLGLYDDTYVIGMRDVVEVIKNNDSLSGIQLFYGGLIPGLGSTVPMQPGEGWIPDTIAWGPSTAYIIGNAQPSVIPTEELDKLVEAYAQGARRSREAGFDFLSFHFCHGSLPHTMLSLLSNQGRTDAYADRFLFCERIIQRTQELCGKDFPIIPRLCCDENLEGGYDIDYFAAEYGPRLHALGIDVLDCTFGSMLQAKSRRNDISSNEFIGPAFFTPKAVNLENIRNLAAGLKAHDAEMKLVGSANLTVPDDLRQMVEDGAAEFAGVCRLSLDDPGFPNKMLRGRENEIRRSTHTGASLLQGNIFGKGWAGSAQNPSFGRDDAYRIQRTNNPKRVLVVGGGSGGMEYAITAAEIGHKVTLYEKTGALGGAMDWAGNYETLPNMSIIRHQPEYHRTMIEKLGVDVRLNSEPEVAELMAQKPDVVVVATGAVAAIPDVPGMAEARAEGRVLTLDEVMAREGARDPGADVIVYGAGLGAELALDLHRQGRKARILDPFAHYIPANYIGSRALAITRFLAAEELAIENGRKLKQINGNAFVFEDAEGGFHEETAERLVLAIGRSPARALADAFAGIDVDVQIIGDARSPRSFGNAIQEAAYLVRQL